MIKAKEVFKFKGMDQNSFSIVAQESIDSARTYEEKLRATLEAAGGECPTCGLLFQMKHCTSFGSDYYYFVPNCQCFEEKKIKLTAIERGMLRVGVPLKFWEKDFDTLRMDLIKPETITAFNQVREYCRTRQYEEQHGKTGIILWGNIGSGKTLSSALIAKELIRAGKKGIFFKMTKFIKAQIDKESIDYVTRARKADFVILDELSKQPIKEGWSQSAVHDFIDFLDENKKIVIITDERPPGELTRYFLPSIYSRISGLTGANIVHFQGDDFRRKERDL